MATPVKTIPEIPKTTTVAITDEFLGKIQNQVRPFKVTWNSMLSQAVTAVLSQ